MVSLGCIQGTQGKTRRDELEISQQNFNITMDEMKQFMFRFFVFFCFYVAKDYKQYCPFQPTSPTQSTTKLPYWKKKKSPGLPGWSDGEVCGSPQRGKQPSTLTITTQQECGVLNQPDVHVSGLSLPVSTKVLNWLQPRSDRMQKYPKQVFLTLKNVLETRRSF